MRSPLQSLAGESSFALFVLASFLAVTGPGQAQQGPNEIESRLAPQQTVSIRAGRWDPVAEEYTSWDSLGGEFIVDPTGTLTLPMVGPISVEGLTVEEVTQQITSQLQERIGLRSEIQIGVTISEYQPVYVLGDVREPGSYPYFPGMTVLQTLSQAGGITRAENALLRGERSALTSIGNYRVMELELLRRLATLERLEAELEDRSMRLSEELSAAPMGDMLIAQERQIKDARDKALASGLSQLNELEDLLEAQIARLDRQIELRDEQSELLQTELENATSLVDRGLSTAPRLSLLERQVADQQVRRLELETARLNAEQDLNETRRDRSELLTQRERELIEGLQTQRSEIEQLRVRMETEASLYSEAMQTGNGVVAMQSGDPPDILVTREEGGEVTVISADRTERVRGGDVIEVLLPELDGTILPGAAGAPQANLPDVLSDTAPMRAGAGGGAEAEPAGEMERPPS